MSTCDHLGRILDLLMQTKKTPQLFALTRESLLLRVTSLIEVIDYDFKASTFYIFHSDSKDLDNQLSDNEKDRVWCDQVIDHAVKILTKS